MRSVTIATALASAALSSACQDSTPDAGPGAQLALAIAPLELTGIDDAVYRLTITNAEGQPVWSRSGLSSSRYGTGRGDLSYVAPCDASSSPNTVALEIEDLFEGGEALPAGSWSNPAPLGTPVTKSFDCLENRDTSVALNLTVLRAAGQGFFDIAVNFEDVFCSAKLDCGDANGPLDLLHDPRTQERGTTLVMGFACTAGPDEGAGVPPTWLWLEPIRVTCGETTYQVDPALGPGNTGALLPLLFQTGIYRGDETLAGVDKCYWNAAFGIDVAHLATHPDGCTLEVRGTASSTWLDGGRTPPETVYPFIHWNVRFAADPGDPTGRAVLCGAAEDPRPTHPLNGLGSQVVTDYTGWGGTRFDLSMACGGGGDVERIGALACEGHIPGRSETVEVRPSEGGLVVTVGAISSPSYALPASVASRTVGGVGDSCCVDPCCAE